jgi:hypothetical protein
MLKKKLILIQLNEINFDVIRLYSHKYNFNFFNKKNLDSLITTASEKEYHLLEPWIQWVSVYTGLSANEHKVFRLGDNQKNSLIQIFENIEENNFEVGAICPMNAKNNLNKTKYFIPDPWSSSKPNNNYINNLIFSTISKLVNNNSKNSVSIIDLFILIFIFLKFFRFNHLKSLFRIIFRLKKKWNKALLLDYILNNIHLSYIYKHKPNFSSIFFNAGAHIQHHYFFNSKLLTNQNFNNPTWYIREEEDPILDMIKFYDDILIGYFNNNSYDILIATGLSQVPYDREKYYYRLKNHSRFLKILNIDFKNVHPRMTRDFLIEFSNQEDQKKCLMRLEAINKLNNKNIFNYDIRKDTIFVTLAISEKVTPESELILENNKKINIYNEVSFVALKNGMHCEKGYILSKGDISNYIQSVILLM